MNLIFFGIIGSGKGTQAELISNKFHIPIISIGNIFRRHIKNKTKLGKQVENILAKGYLVSDDITIKILKKELKKINTKEGIIIDGYPRTLHQAKMLENILKIDYVFNISLSEREALSRISKRRSCKCGATYHIEYNPPKKEGICDKCGRKLFIRNDSKPEVIKNRIHIYKNKTEKILDFYKKNKILININGSLPIKQVFDIMCDKIKKLKIK